MKTFEDIGGRLRLLRKGRSRKEFAELLHIAFGSYVRYESGQRIPPPNVLARISESCEVSVDWILTGLPDKETRSKYHSRDLREMILQKYQDKCVICGFGVKSILRVSPTDPRLQGTDDISNLVVLCPNCHAMLAHRMIPWEAVRLIAKRLEKKAST